MQPIAAAASPSPLHPHRPSPAAYKTPATSAPPAKKRASTGKTPQPVSPPCARERAAARVQRMGPSRRVERPVAERSGAAPPHCCTLVPVSRRQETQLPPRPPPRHAPSEPSEPHGRRPRRRPPREGRPLAWRGAVATAARHRRCRFVDVSGQQPPPPPPVSAAAREWREQHEATGRNKETVQVGGCTDTRKKGLTGPEEKWEESVTEQAANEVVLAMQTTLVTETANKMATKPPPTRRAHILSLSRPSATTKLGRRNTKRT